eukprot:3196315-Amphidinium_carterae.1
MGDTGYRMKNRPSNSVGDSRLQVTVTPVMSFTGGQRWYTQILFKHAEICLRLMIFLATDDHGQSTTSLFNFVAWIDSQLVIVCQPLDRMIMRPLKAAIHRQASADFAKDITDTYTSGGTFEIKSGLVHNRPRLPGW